MDPYKDYSMHFYEWHLGCLVVACHIVESMHIIVLVVFYNKLTFNVYAFMELVACTSFSMSIMIITLHSYSGSLQHLSFITLFHACIIVCI